MPSRIKDFEGPDHVREELPPKRHARLYKGEHISAPTEERLIYEDGKPRRVRRTFVTGPSKYVEHHIMDLEWGVEILLPNGQKLMVKSAGKDHVQIMGGEALEIRPSCSNVIYVGVAADSVNTNPPSEEEIGS